MDNTELFDSWESYTPTEAEVAQSWEIYDVVLGDVPQLMQSPNTK